MRRMVILDSDSERIIRRQMRERGMTFKEALNDVIRRGASERTADRPFRTQTAEMGESRVNLYRALQVVPELGSSQPPPE